MTCWRLHWAHTLIVLVRFAEVMFLAECDGCVRVVRRHAVDHNIGVVACRSNKNGFSAARRQPVSYGVEAEGLDLRDAGATQHDPNFERVNVLFWRWRRPGELGPHAAERVHRGLQVVKHGCCGSRDAEDKAMNGGASRERALFSAVSKQ